MQLTPLNTHDLAVATEALDELERADDALRDLHEHLRAKEDSARSRRVKLALARVGEAREIVAGSFQ